MATDPPRLVPDDVWALIRAEEGTVDLHTFLNALVTIAHQPGRSLDFVAAGRIASRAWAGLREETRAALARAAGPPQPVVVEEDDPMLAFLEDPFVESLDQEVRVTRHLMETPVLQTPVRRPPLGRRVTLLELVTALEVAYAEAAQAMERQDEAARRRAAARAAREAQVQSYHAEDPNEDVARVALHIPWDGEARLHALSAASGVDRVGVFQAILTLAKQGRVRIEQADFPFGPIVVRRAL